MEGGRFITSNSQFNSVEGGRFIKSNSKFNHVEDVDFIASNSNTVVDAVLEYCESAENLEVSTSLFEALAHAYGIPELLSELIQYGERTLIM